MSQRHLRSAGQLEMTMFSMLRSLGKSQANLHSESREGMFAMKSAKAKRPSIMRHLVLGN